MRYAFLFILFFSSLASAESYFWTGPNSQHASSAQAACLPSVAGLTLTTVEMNGIGSATCVYTGPNSEGTVITYRGSVVNRQGDSCPSGTSYNDVTGGCSNPEQDKCSANKGVTSSNYSWDQTTDTPSKSISIDGCEAAIEYASCLPTTSGQYTCLGDISFTGDLYKPPVIPTDPTTPTTPTPTPDPGTGTGTGSGDGTGTGSDNGNPGNTPGTGTGDGSGTGSGDSGTGTGGGNSGSGSGSSGSGSGSGGGSTGGGSGGTTPGTGTDTGTTPGTGGGTDPGTGTGGDGTCDTDCGEGDGPSTTSLSAPEQGSFDGQGEEWDQKISDSKDQIKQGIEDLKGVFSPIGDLSLGGGGSLYCPPPVPVLGHSISFCMDKYSNYLSWIGSAVYAACAVVALFIVFG
jgi:hypothetical protein